MLAFAIFTCSVLGVFDLVNVIVAAVRSYHGEAYRYPITLRLTLKEETCSEVNDNE